MVCRGARNLAGGPFRGKDCAGDWSVQMCERFGRFGVCAVIFSPGGVRIGYIRRAMCGRSSTDSTPMTGSLVFFAPLDCLDVYCAAECASCWLFCGTDCVCLANCGIFIWQVGLYWIMAMEGAALVEDRAGITFGVELYVPWDAPEAVVDIHSEGVVPLGSVPDVVGLVGRMLRKAVFCKGGMSAVPDSGSRFARTGSDLS